MSISIEIKKVAEKNHVFLEILRYEQSKAVREMVYCKYANQNDSSFLWEMLFDISVCNSSNAWRLIGDFIGAKKCLMFFDEDEDESVIAINNGSDLYKILCETYGYEFYITEFTTNYLLCFNHHDCLLGCGVAKDWVNTLKESI